MFQSRSIGGKTKVVNGIIWMLYIKDWVLLGDKHENFFASRKLPTCVEGLISL